MKKQKTIKFKEAPTKKPVKGYIKKLTRGKA
jgi:hypothetical protein